MAKALLSINPHILFGLEGGYDLTALAESVLEVCKAVVWCLTKGIEFWNVFM